MPNGDSQIVIGPDQKKYKFPSGTTKDQAISYFKKKGVGVSAAPASPTPASAPTSQPSPSAPKAEGLTLAQGNNKTLDEFQGAIQRWRPRWDDPSKLLQDPTWYGRSAKYLGGEAIGAGKAASGVLTGTTKLFNDVRASIDPVEYYVRGLKDPGESLGKDIIDTGKGMLNLGKAAYDLVRHFPESSQDPEAFGSTVSQIAMTVDGALKGAKPAAEHLGFNPNEAMLVAKKIADSSVNGLLRQSTIGETYVHKNGVGVAKDIVTAVQEADKEIEVHVNNLDQIDKNVPAGVIDAAEEADDIKDAFKDIVKTPDPLNKTLNEMVEDAKNTAPGQWTFEKTRQFRSKVGRALSSMKGPDYAVGSRVYQDLTRKLSGVAEAYGLEDSWNQYNELQRKVYKSFGIIDTARDIVDSNGEGAKMASALKDKAVLKEVIDSLKNYGLDEDKITKYATKANKVISSRADFNKSFFKYIYSRPGGYAGLPVALATRMLVGGGAGGYLAGFGAGTLTGIGMTYLIHAVRAAMLSPEILDGILDERKWPGKLAPLEGSFPTLEGTEAPKVTGPQPSGGAPQLPAAPSALVDKSSAQAAELPQPETKPTEVPGSKSISTKAKAAQVAKESKVADAKTEPQVTKVPEGQHGRGPIARQAKARERVAQVRAEKGSTALGGGTQEISGGDVAGEIAKAQERVASPNRDLANLQIPEMEEALRMKNKKDFDMLQKFKKTKQITDEEYQQGLKHFLILAYEDDLKTGEE